MRARKGEVGELFTRGGDARHFAGRLFVSYGLPKFHVQGQAGDLMDGENCVVRFGGQTWQTASNWMMVRCLLASCYCCFRAVLRH